MLVDIVGHAVTTEAPFRPSAAELRVMALRQQQQIESQHKLLTAKEQRLKFLKEQEPTNMMHVAEDEKLKRLHERVEIQENKLRQLRALRGQIDLHKTYNISLNNDLDSIRALFSEKEKELSMAVAKVDALTRQLEEFKQDRRYSSNISSAIGIVNTQPTLPSVREIDKLRKELMYRNQLSLQQDARLHFQRAALQQRQAELLSIDQRIFELQNRLQKRKASGSIQESLAENFSGGGNTFKQTLKHGLVSKAGTDFIEINKGRLKVWPTKNVYPLRLNPRGNIAAVEPFVHTPQNSIINDPTNNSIKETNGTVEKSLVETLKKAEQNMPGYLNTNILTGSDDEKTLQQNMEKKVKRDEFDAKKNIDEKKLNSENVVNFIQLNELLFGKKKDEVNIRNMYDTNHSTASHSNSSSLSLERPADLVDPYVNEKKSSLKNQSVSKIPSGNLVVPPRKPISSVAPTPILETASKAKKPKVSMVTPNVVPPSDANSSRPALPPKPKNNRPATDSKGMSPLSESPFSAESSQEALNVSQSIITNLQSAQDNLPIKARPLTIKKQPLSEQPRLKLATVATKTIRKKETAHSVSPLGVSKESQPSAENKIDSNQNEKSEDTVDATSERKSPDLKRRNKYLSFEQHKSKLSRRVSFDPLALLLDASLEGELELVKKTAVEVANPSAANDEGITALHNAICAGHFDIVKFLIEVGCDVNAQDSDGWTPLHCAASCNNLAMVKFLVESGACMFAATLSDHETPAEKCEEDEEGFDGCSEYLYGIQEKLGILNKGVVYAVFSYEAQRSDELSFNVNDLLTIIRKGDDEEREWWWARNESNEEGYVPRNLLGLYPRVTPLSPAR